MFSRAGESRNKAGYTSQEMVWIDFKKKFLKIVKKIKAPNNRRDKSSKNTDLSLCFAKSLLVYTSFIALLYSTYNF